MGTKCGDVNVYIYSEHSGVDGSVQLDSNKPFILTGLDCDVKELRIF